MIQLPLLISLEGVAPRMKQEQYESLFIQFSNEWERKLKRILMILATFVLLSQVYAAMKNDNVIPVKSMKLEGIPYEYNVAKKWIESMHVQ